MRTLEPLDENVRRLELVGPRVLLDEGSVAGSDGRLARDARRPRDGVGVVLRHDCS